MLEEQLKRIADSLETIAQSLTNSQTLTGSDSITLVEPAAETPKKTKTKVKETVAKSDISEEAIVSDTPDKITEDDIKEALKGLLNAKGAEKAKNILLKYGANRLSEIPQNRAREVYDEMKRVTNEK